MTFLKASVKLIFWWAIVGGLAVILIAASAFLYISPKLPPADSYRSIRLENPLRIYSADNKLIAEFGNQKRDPVKYDEIPPLLVNALIASEDSRFYSHHGVDLKALTRSVFGIITGNQNGGGSTITMQVAKNISFEGEDPYSRKFKEILLALQIERELSKEAIIELYLNRIFFGISAYGISAAATQYYNKSLDQLELAEMAMTIAILPSPNAYNPLRSPERAIHVRNRVLRRMLSLDMISQQQFTQANTAPLTAKRYGRQPELEAPYIAEMVRLEMVKRFGQHALTDGLNVYTTIDSQKQIIANAALKNGLETYDRRHGYRGRENQMLPTDSDSTAQWLRILAKTPTIASQQPAFVQSIEDQSITALLQNGNSVTIPWDGIRWAKKFINTNTWNRSPRSAQEVAEVGDLIRVRQTIDGGWVLGQIPAVNGGIVSMDPNNGAIQALVGGYDFNDSKFNRITQAERQPGSNFKPFLYSAALENGYTAASLVNDAPLPRSDYRPENYGGKFLGPLRLKYALTTSKNLVSLRLYNALTSNIVLPYISKFGFSGNTFPTNDLTVAIGSHAVKPLEVATAYSVFANGGYKVEPYFIDRIESFNDGEIYLAEPNTVCPSCLSKTTPTTEPVIANTSSITGAINAEDMLSLLEEALAEIENNEASDESATSLELDEGLSQTTANAADTAPIIRSFPEAPRVIDESVAYIMNTILQSVITSGSGRRANREIARHDLAGKTGTTNDYTDLWFSGFNSDLVTTVFVGFDQPQSLGDAEEASIVSLPIWIEYMKSVLENEPESFMAQPDGLVTVRINRETGLRARANESNTIFEVFREENMPAYSPNKPSPNASKEGSESPAVDNIF